MFKQYSLLSFYPIFLSLAIVILLCIFEPGSTEIFSNINLMEDEGTTGNLGVVPSTTSEIKFPKALSDGFLEHVPLKSRDELFKELENKSFEIIEKQLPVIVEEDHPVIVQGTNYGRDIWRLS